ncbi:MAG: hypothetical protein C4334_10395 [Pyrinomonas sp.]
MLSQDPGKMESKVAWIAKRTESGSLAIAFRRWNVRSISAKDEGPRVRIRDVNADALGRPETIDFRSFC